MKDQALFWFRTDQSLLEEWGYTPGVWHLVFRSQLSIVIIGVSAEGQPCRSATGSLSAHYETRVPLALLNMALCEFRGPFSATVVLPPNAAARIDDSASSALAA